MATIAHRHRPAKMSDSPFLGCVALAGQCSPASHGRNHTRADMHVRSNAPREQRRALCGGARPLDEGRLS